MCHARVISNLLSVCNVVTARTAEQETYHYHTRGGERESRFLTTHQHILGYKVSFTLYDLHKMDSRQLKMTDDRVKKPSTTQKN